MPALFAGELDEDVVSWQLAMVLAAIPALDAAPAEIVDVPAAFPEPVEPVESVADGLDAAGIDPLIAWRRSLTAIRTHPD